MSSRKTQQRLQDILARVEEALQFTADLNYEEFCADTKTVNAVLYDLAVIGEVAASLLPDIALDYPDIPWEDMRAMRNIAIHEYFRVNLEIVWATVREDLPPLIEQVKTSIAAYERQ